MSYCPTCRAHNPDGADWCSQCYARLNEPPPPPPPPPAPEPVEPPPTAMPPGTPATRASGVFAPREVPVDPVAATPAEVEARKTDAGRFRRTAEGLDWECQVCQQWNPIEVTRCGVCQTPFTRSATLHVADPRPKPVDQNLALLSSVLLPGTGHYLMGYVANGVGRAVVYLFCLIGGFSLVRGAAQANASITPALPLLAGAMLILFITVFDTVLALSGRVDDEILGGRRFFWFVVGILGALMISFAASATQIQLDPGDGTTTGGTFTTTDGTFSTTDGTTTGSATDGTATDGTATDGSGTDQTATDGTTDGTTGTGTPDATTDGSGVGTTDATAGTGT